MSDFISSNLHKKVDHLMDIFFGAGVASHPTIIEQINYLLFMRALSQKDDDLKKIGVTDKGEIVFDGELEKYHWENLLTLNAEQLFIALEECFRKIPESTTNRTVRLVFRNAHIKLFDKPSLRTVVHELDAFAKLMDDEEHDGKRDIFGDTYEYLLSKLSQAGTSGQFRTPRHIIEFLVAVVAPKKGETILDPAVGTAGFLVKAFEYLRREYTSPEQLASGGTFDQLSSKEHSFLYEHTFSGFDSDEDMIKFGMMNLYLHGLQNAKLIRQNTLTDTAGSRDKYDVILANPPFSGKIDRDSVAEELQMNTGATEVLFLRYMIRHLTDIGRAGVIVPEGVLFNAAGGYTKIRELLLENGLWCVVSLPGGVFNPYAGVKTSILFFDKTRKEKAEVLFAKVENDGFSLSAQRKPILKNDLPEILLDIQRYQNGEELRLMNVHAVSYDRIKNTKDYNLSGDRFKLVEDETEQNWPLVKLDDLLTIERGASPRPIDQYMTLDLNGENWIKIGDTKNATKYIHSVAEKVTKAGAAKSRRVEVDDFILSNSMSFGRPYIMKTTGYIHDGWLLLRIKDSAKLSADYLYEILSSQFVQRQFEAAATGGVVRNLNSKLVREVSIPLPPINVQNKVIEAIKNKQKAVDTARELIKSLERERAYFDPSARARKEGWDIVRLGDVASLVRGPFGGSLKKEIFKNSGYKVYEQNDAIHGDLDSTRYFIDEAKFTEMKRFQVQPNDLIMSCSGTLGKISVITESSPIGIINQALLKITPKSDVLPAFLKLILESTLMQRVLLSNSQGGVIQNVVSVKQLADMEFPLPPLKVQAEIVADFAEEDSIIASNRKIIDIYVQKIDQALAEI